MTDSAQDSDFTPETTNPPTESGSTSSSKPRGLWSVIAQSSGPMTTDVVPGTVSEQPESEQPPTASPQSLFAVMRRAESVHRELDEARDPAANTENEIPTAEDLPDVSQQVDLEPIASFTPPMAQESAAKIVSQARAKRRRQGSVTLLCGLVSVPLAALSLRPEFWMTFPGSAIGFLAIMLGYMTLTGCRLRDLSSMTKITAQAGMLLGTLGLFLGPVVFARIGRELRESSGNLQTRRHLKTIGDGLDRFYEAHRSYPVGGTFVVEKSGAFRGQHGWMTFLLPYVAEQRLYEQIDQSKPFDAPENRLAMGHDVESYFAAGGDRTKIGQGFSVSHFAGVGGDVDDESRLLHAGIFTRDRALVKADVTDGLASTLIVGEVAGNYAPWGDPENWRTIGKGLNKDANGFGNFAGTGAMFLSGDGNIRMFSNKTDRKLLRQLSTRDGGEKLP